MTLALWLSLVAVLLLVVQRQRRPGHVRQRSEEHEAYLAFLTEIMRDDELRRLMIERGTGTAVGIAGFRESMDRLRYPFLRACAAKLLSDRIVRRQVAKVVAENHRDIKGDRKKVLRELGGVVEEVRG